MSRIILTVLLMGHILSGNEGVVRLQDQLILTERTVKAAGVGAVVEGNTADARRTALRDAQRNAVEQICGTFIASETSVENFQMLNDRIFSHASGFIEEYYVENEGVQGTVYRVEITATIKIESLKDEIRALGILIEEHGFPKIMLIVDETFDQDGGETAVTHPTLPAEIENTLLSKGFIIVAKDYSDRLRTQERELMAAVIADDQKAAEIALSYGAEVVITGANAIAYLGERNSFHQSDATASIRAIIASTAQVIANVQKQERGAGDRPVNSAMAASKKVAAGVTDNLIERIVQNWRQVEDRGVHFIVTLYGIKSYRREGMAFIGLIKAVPDVVDVQQRSFGGGRLELDVRYKKDLNELLAGIWAQMEGNPVFESVDQREAIGNNLIFEFME